jgi:NAD+ synthase (glutamine-hydrolysing)
MLQEAVMKDGWIKAGASSPALTVADPAANTDKILEEITALDQEGCKIMVFPELCVTGYTCGDLFFQERLLDEADEQLERIRKRSETVDALIFIGFPLLTGGKLYNTAAVLNRGRVLGFVPKKNLPNYNEFYEARQFTKAPDKTRTILWHGTQVPFGTNLLFACTSVKNLVVAAEICEDMWVPDPPDVHHALAGADIIVNLSASNEIIGKYEYRRSLVSTRSATLIAGYIYCSSGTGESTQDLVFGGHRMICENGTMLAESGRFLNPDESSHTISEIDVDRLISERHRMTTFPGASDTQEADSYVTVPFELNVSETKLTRAYDPHPFVPSDPAARARRCEEILNIQTLGLVKRLSHIHAQHVVIGISGGLDSTLALLISVRAFDRLSIPRKNILAVTMPCFGTTNRTYTNACDLVRETGAELREINIEKAVLQHFSDIRQDPSVHDAAYENGQARERTQILMDLANQNGGIVIGTGDLSESALGWATYNGDHMSMYGVNCTIPKTLVRYLIRWYADNCGDEILEKTLTDILDTPVSPELLPPTENGTISQKTEDLVGPYELHDFFLYYMLRLAFPPHKIRRIAYLTFEGVYDHETIDKWLRVFYRRFFSQQFKRSCLPDGPKVGSVALSPRGDLRMPSDASAAAWLSDL